jgi:hypothetical protein
LLLWIVRPPCPCKKVELVILPTKRDATLCEIAHLQTVETLSEDVFDITHELFHINTLVEKENAVVVDLAFDGSFPPKEPDFATRSILNLIVFSLIFLRLSRSLLFFVLTSSDGFKLSLKSASSRADKRGVSL